MKRPAIMANPSLLVTLAAAVIQGIVLYWLHDALGEKRWPGTHTGALVAIYSLFLFVPLTVQLLSQHWRTPLLWWTAAAMGALFAYFGWHFGSQVAAPAPGDPFSDEALVVYGIRLIVLWVLFIPFLRCRLTAGRWRCEYAQLFSCAWQSCLMLVEAALFTGIFWLLLALWAVLFKMLGYDAFQTLFTRPAFIYPFTAIAFGAALHLTGSVERLVAAAREQILGLLKWLAPVAALILALFTPALLFKLPDLVFHGERAIGAAWLLWLLAVTVLLLNAGYQNGLVEKPYPRGLAFALRCVVPAMAVVAAIALYALVVRAAEYGLTVERVFALIVALAALGYAVGYAAAAVRRGPWLKGIERVNIGVAITLIAVIALTLTPIFSPYRLAAASQSSRLLGGRIADTQNALRYLRFDTGRYGLDALKRIAAVQGDGRLAQLSQGAKRMLAVQNLQNVRRAHGIDADALLSGMEIYPSGRALEPALAAAIRNDLKTRPVAYTVPMPPEETPMAVFVDLNADATEECVVLFALEARLYSRQDGAWMALPPTPPSHLIRRDQRQALRASLAAGDFGPQPAPWQQLRIGSEVIDAAR